jgi:ATP adenylyltransferase/5',5'''-P-1,P-4-tetraphosphate phosphorylase II
MAQTHLHFDMYIGRKKPENVRNREADCPFCDRGSLTGVLEQRGSMIWLMNKYPVLLDTFQTVLIESDDCDGDWSVYTREHAHSLLAFGVEKWLEMERSGSYRSVLFFKNHGPYSGGSIRHPHMQIVGLNRYDYQQQVRDQDFVGVLIDREAGVELNLSTHPRAGFFEYNVVLSDREQLAKMAEYLQIMAHWILTCVNPRYQSYNFFFYRRGETLIAKAVPRFVTSPLFVGYSIPQVANNLDEVVREIRRRYF